MCCAYAIYLNLILVCGCRLLATTEVSANMAQTWDTREMFHYHRMRQASLQPNAQTGALSLKVREEADR